MILAAQWYHTILAFFFAILALLIMVVILLQRGKGVGLAGAFGGSGGASAFGAKTGDVFTWVTIVGAGLLLVFTVILNWVFVEDTGPLLQGTQATAPPPGMPPQGMPPQGMPPGQPGTPTRMQLPGGTPTQMPGATPIQVPPSPTAAPVTPAPPPTTPPPAQAAPSAAPPPAQQPAESGSDQGATLRWPNGHVGPALASLGIFGVEDA